MSRLLGVAGYLLWAIIHAGWWLHRSPPDDRVLGPYSARYLLLLAVMALPFAVPPALGRRQGDRPHLRR